jgi:paraquat-inducible protein A
MQHDITQAATGPALMACHECDLLIRPADAQGAAHYSALCPRCGALLYRRSRHGLENTLALAFAALAMLVVANAFPVVGLDIQGQRIQTTVAGAAWRLWQERMPIMSILVLMTTILMPLLEIAGVIWLLLPLTFAKRPPAFGLVFRTLQAAHPWAMVEVFILGILVALVKLAHLADVLPGPAMVGFATLMLILATMSSIMEPRDVWQAWEDAKE